MTYPLKTYGDALFAHSLEQDLLTQIAEIAEDSWAGNLDESAVGRAFLTIQTLAMRAAKLNAVTNEIFGDVAGQKMHQQVRDALQGAELIGGGGADRHGDTQEADHA